MVLSRKKTVLTFSVILNFLATRYGILVDAMDPTDRSDATSNYNLALEDYSDKTVIEIVKWKTHVDVLLQPISKLSRTRRREICVAAKKLANLDGMGPKDDVFFAYGYKFDIPIAKPKEIDAPESQPEIDASVSQSRLIYAVRCYTIPVSFFYLIAGPQTGASATAEDKTIDLSQMEIRILLKENKYKSEDYKFITQVLEADKKPVLQDVSRIGSLPVIESRLPMSENIITDTEANYLDMCHAAKLRCGYEPTPILEDYSIGKPQIYQFPDDYLAYSIKCPSSPPMYLHFMDSDYKIMVTIVPGEAETESKQKVEKSAAGTSASSPSKN